MNVYRFVSATILLCIFGNLIGVEWSEPELIASTASAPFLAIGNDGICWCEAWPWMYSYRSETSGWQLEIELGVGYWERPCFDKGDTLWLLDDDNYNFMGISHDSGPI